MHKILFIFLTFPSFLFSQDRADEILNIVSKKTASYSNIEAHFTNTIISEAADINESQKGVLYVQGDLYRLELKEQTIISNGESNWIHLIDENEVQIIEVDEEEESVVSDEKNKLESAVTWLLRDVEEEEEAKVDDVEENAH